MYLKFDLEKYRNIKSTVEYSKVLEELKESHLDFDKVSLLAATANLNVISLYYFIMEDVPDWSDQCTEKINTLKEFYGYE